MCDEAPDHHSPDYSSLINWSPDVMTSEPEDRTTRELSPESMSMLAMGDAVWSRSHASYSDVLLSAKLRTDYLYGPGRHAAGAELPRSLHTDPLARLLRRHSTARTDGTSRCVGTSLPTKAGTLSSNLPRMVYRGPKANCGCGFVLQVLVFSAGAPDPRYPSGHPGGSPGPGPLFYEVFQAFRRGRRTYGPRCRPAAL